MANKIIRVLVIAPDQPEINSVPEIREISSKANLHTTILNGTVTCADVFRYCKERHAILHFATHGDGEGLVLSDGVMSPADIAQAARIAKASIIFMNSCDSAKLASYIVAHGVIWSMQGNEEILDTSAWKIMLAFYSALDDMEPISIVNAMRVALDGTGVYGHTVSLEYLAGILESSRWSRVQLASWQVALVAILATTTILMAVLALARGV